MVPHALICCSWNVTSNGQILALYDAYAVAGMLETVTETYAKADKLVTFNTIKTVDLYMAIRRCGIANPYLDTAFFYSGHHTVERSTVHTY